MRKGFCVAALLCGMLFLTACNKETGAAPTGAAPTAVAEPENEATKPAAEPTITPAPTATTAPTPTKVPTPTPVPVDRTAARELVEKLNVGWNLGNTFDSHGAQKAVDNETYWGNPFTTKEMLQAIYDQGIHSIRIPVTWAQGIGAAPDYKVDEELLSRVETVVRDALSIGFYVVLNTHHEPDFWLKPKEEGLSEVSAKLSALWRQIALKFADCDEHLIFEGMNEPRIKGSKEEWSGGTKEGRAAVNTLNMAFLDAVRQTGGNNETRLLVLATYGNSVTMMTMFDLYLPADPYIAVAAHLYTPYYFTFEAANSYPTWTDSKRTEITGNFKLLKEYIIDKGVPVLITEFGAVNKTVTAEDGTKTTNRADRLAWLSTYMEEANKLSMKCFWWDNGIHDSSGERFGIFDRNSLTFWEQEIADALVANAVSAE